jgi:GTP cyclohydrolase I
LGMKPKVDPRQAAVEKHTREVLKILKVDLNAEQFRDTPRRIARMAFELLAGMDKRNEPKLTLFKNTGYRDILILKDIPFYSLCAHHLLPMFGHVSIAYIPGRNIVGLSKLPRIVKFFSARLQVQEDFTKELADYLQEKLRAEGVFVIVKARHLCMEMRGAKTHDVETVSSAVRGVFDTHASTKEEALKLMTT